VEAHPGRSGIAALPDGRDAFAARALLADAAERTLDARYYMWHNDMSGSMLFSALRRAADRGVQVRLLLDDNNTAGLDSRPRRRSTRTPNIAVRLFQSVQGPALAPARLSHGLQAPQPADATTSRSAPTVKSPSSVGATSATSYFDAGQGGAPWFVDLDVLAIGPVVSDVSRDFDRYWASASSIPPRACYPVPPQHRSPGWQPTLRGSSTTRTPRPTERRFARSSFVRDLLGHRLTFDWAGTRMLSDDPAKGLGGHRRTPCCGTGFKEILRAPMQELRLVSPYFVPGSAGVEAWRSSRDRV